MFSGITSVTTAMHTLLKDSPLTVNPATPFARRPGPVSLPYDLDALPKDAAGLVQSIRQTELPALDAIATSAASASASATDAGPQPVDTYVAWEKDIRRQNPGFNTSAYVMAPTVRR